jgi:hypothetical protein
MSPSAGRFLTRDPIGFDGSEWGLYEYCESSPNSLVDPIGECAICCCCCCADDIAIKNVKKIDTKTHLGHSFDAVVSLSYVVAKNNNDCSFKWYETSSLPPPVTPPLTPGVEEDMTSKFPKSKTYAPWGKRKKPCPGSEPVTFSDSPALAKETAPGKPRTDKRTLKIRIVVTSAIDCPCSKKEVSATAVQELSLVGGVKKVHEFDVK